MAIRTLAAIAFAALLGVGAAVTVKPAHAYTCWTSCAYGTCMTNCY